MTIDISKIRPGDKVTLVPLEVWATDDALDLIYVTDHEGGACFHADQIAAHHPAPREFQVGDRVRLGVGKYGTIRAVDGDDAWVLWDENGRNQGILIEALTLVEGGE